MTKEEAAVIDAAEQWLIGSCPSTLLNDAVTALHESRKPREKWHFEGGTNRRFIWEGDIIRLELLRPAGGSTLESEIRLAQRVCRLLNDEDKANDANPTLPSGAFA